MDVVDDLPALGPGIAGEAVPALRVADALAEEARHVDAPPDQRSVARLEARDGLDVASRDDQEMDRRLRVEVAERHDLVVFVLDLGRALLGRDATEDAGLGHGSSRSCIMLDASHPVSNSVGGE